MRNLTRIVVTIQSASELESQLDPGVCDLLEFRLDLDPTLIDRIGKQKLPVLATLRSRREGGAAEESGDAARALLQEALRRGAALVDLEEQRDDPAHFAREQVILSHHDPLGTPAELTSIVDRLTAPRPAVAKLACMATSGAELARLLALYERPWPSPLAVVAMGAIGVPARALAGKLGAAMMWCSAPGSAPAAPGQLDARELVTGFRAREVSSESPVYAVVGCPVSHSGSPTFHNASFPTEPGAPRPIYIPLELPDLDALPVLTEKLGIAGLSVTLPHKLAAASVLRAKRQSPSDDGGSCNTLWRDAGGSEWLAASTDVAGIRAALARARFELAGARVAVLGSGGAARAAIVAAREGGAQVTVVARAAGPGRELAARAGAEFTQWGALASADAPAVDLVIHATPVGMSPDSRRLPCAPHALGSQAVLFDLVYTPVMTRWLAAAKLSGQRVILGTSMFVHQALAQQRLWFGREGDEMAGRQALLARLPAGEPVLWLVGARGSGKSTVGRKLARASGIFFIDLDERIARVAGMPAGRLLAERGEEAFRRVETSCLESILERSGEPQVVATGGGIILRHAAKLAEVGFVAYLRAPADVLAARVEADSTERPPLFPGLDPLAEARRVLQEREPLYRNCATIEVETSDRSADEVVTELQRQLGRVTSG